MELMTKTIEQTCRICGIEITGVTPVDFYGMRFGATVCDDCDEQRNAQEQSARRSETARALQKSFEQICPPLFRLASPGSEPTDNGPTNLDHPGFPKKLYRRVADWQHAPRGVGVCGSTGLAKTRIMWILIHRLWMDGIRTEPTTAVELQRAIQNQWRDDQLKGRLQSFREAPVLFIDDVGNEKLTDSVDSEFFDILDERMRWQRPILWTTNYGKAEFQEKWPEPMLRRLTDFCTIIEA